VVFFTKKRTIQNLHMALDTDGKDIPNFMHYS